MGSFDSQDLDEIYDFEAKKAKKSHVAVKKFVKQVKRLTRHKSLQETSKPMIIPFSEYESDYSTQCM